jgi:hypothetical protein
MTEPAGWTLWLGFIDRIASALSAGLAGMVASSFVWSAPGGGYACAGGRSVEGERAT